MVCPLRMTVSERGRPLTLGPMLHKVETARTIGKNAQRASAGTPGAWDTSSGPNRPPNLVAAAAMPLPLARSDVGYSSAAYGESIASMPLLLASRSAVRVTNEAESPGCAGLAAAKAASTAATVAA